VNCQLKKDLAVRDNKLAPRACGASAPPSTTPIHLTMSLCLLILAACLNPEVREVPAHDVLASVRTAMGADALEAMAGGVHVSGSCHEHGVDGTFDFLFNRRGAFKHGVRSRIGEQVAFDGETGWASDSSGLVRRTSFSARASSQGWLWVQSGRWLAADSPFLITRREGLVDDGASIALHLVHRDAPWEATLYVDSDSHLPRRLVRQRPAGERVYSFDDWKGDLGFQYPHRVMVKNVAGDISTFEADEVAKAPSFFRDPFEAIFRRPTDAVFDGAKPSRVEARRMSTGHIVVHPTVGGKDLGWFILDSGAGAMCIDPGVADELGLEAFGEVSVVGTGGATPGRFRSGAILELGPLRMPDISWLELDTSFLEPFFGVPVAGVIGYEFFARAVVSLDLVAGQVEVHDPDQFKLDGEWQPLLLDDRIPCVQASFEGDRQDWFRLDTGSNDTVTFHAPTVERLELLEGRKTYAAAHSGVGGTGHARRGRLDWFELSGVRMEDIDVSFSTSARSALATPFTAGNLGGGTLEAFKLVLDYGGERIAFLRRPE